MDREILHRRRVPSSEMFGILGGHTLEGGMDNRSIASVSLLFPFSCLSFASGWARQPGAPRNNLAPLLGYEGRRHRAESTVYEGCRIRYKRAERLCHDLHSVIRKGGWVGW